MVILPLILLIAVSRWNDRFEKTLIAKVNGDLTIAHQYMARILEATGDKIQALSKAATFRDLLAQSAPIAPFLEKHRNELGLDFLYLVESEAGVLASAPHLQTSKPPTRPPHWPIVASALENGAPGTAIDIYSSAQLHQISAQLAARSRLALVTTANAKPTDKTEEARGMVIHSAAPVRDSSGRAMALVGGILLNQNLVFIDTINDLVYRAASLPDGSKGTATLFLDDVRISTNVRLFEGERALGTRVSAVVREAVLDNGRTWLDSAFVVNDWYISAYEPILDSFGKRVGMLYVGFLEAPFTQARRETLLTIILAFLIITALTVPIFLLLARTIFRPLEHMTKTIASVESGHMGARSGFARANDEIGRVANHLDTLLDQIQERDRQLREWNDDLNRRVEERTHELQIANRQLEATSKQLVMSEKLAAIGEITAGVAHEINNPIAVIQGNLEVVRRAIGTQAESLETEFRLLDEQVYRVTQIVTKLLQFARPEEYADYISRHRPQDVVSDCLPLIRHLLDKSEIEISRQDDATRMVLMNRTELQQVVINLIVNAIHAMPEGGMLTLRTCDSSRAERPGIRLDVADTGIGIAPEILDRIFDPFFTTKRHQGNGLGLSITRKLIDRQGGEITVESAPGHGTTFSVWLPEAV
ncbi:MAG: cache domain-containing protein [Hyphomicrobiaceae bacterium]|nr:cache domain-containing protein [Hyphomicrobiaceae bacterium]